MTNTTTSDATAFKSIGRRRMKAAFGDIGDGARLYELWMFLGWRDVQKQYSRSLIGPFWLTISMGAMVAGMGLLYALIFQIPVGEYLPYLSIGLIMWGFISSLLNSSCTVYSAASGPIRQSRIPMSVYILQLTWTQLIILAHNMIIYVIVAIIFGIVPNIYTLLFFPALALIIINSVFAAMILGPVCARFRDVPMIVASVLQLTFFVTPIIWSADQLPERAFFVNVNPFYHFIEIVRAPLLGEAASSLNWAVALAITVMMGIVSIVFFARYRARVPYWV